MSILTGPLIRQIVHRTKAAYESDYDPILPIIDITPFDPERVGPNSYDLTLSPDLLMYWNEYEKGHRSCDILDMKTINKVEALTIPPEGIVLQPGTLYLGSTVEKTACAGVVPYIDGRSSVGRLGLFLHVTAGAGDDGFGMGVPGGCSWTLEMCVVQPLRIYAGIRVAQIRFHTIQGDRMPYKGRYRTQDGPQPSKLWKDFQPKQEGT